VKVGFSSQYILAASYS